MMRALLLGIVLAAIRHPRVNGLCILIISAIDTGLRVVFIPGKLLENEERDFARPDARSLIILNMKSVYFRSGLGSTYLHHVFEHLQSRNCVRYAAFQFELRCIFFFRFLCPQC